MNNKKVFTVVLLDNDNVETYVSTFSTLEKAWNYALEDAKEFSHLKDVEITEENCDYFCENEGFRIEELTYQIHVTVLK